MSHLSTLPLVGEPIARPKHRETELRKRIAALEAERDLWRTECLVVRERLTESVINGVLLANRLQELAPVDWDFCTCVPSRAEALAAQKRSQALSDLAASDADII